jgi:hypothetical protein
VSSEVIRSHFTCSWLSCEETTYSFGYPLDRPSRRGTLLLVPLSFCPGHGGHHHYNNNNNNNNNNKAAATSLKITTGHNALCRKGRSELCWLPFEGRLLHSIGSGYEGKTDFKAHDSNLFYDNYGHNALCRKGRGGLCCLLPEIPARPPAAVPVEAVLRGDMSPK